ncbi:FAD-dependent monooxygenase [Oscillatoria sp. CS-180]|uniref:FAD-dependent monooxygenase n=1 Tax=Oscillatoria sp. CS-180 TaxID=3021720 RepID=UPI00232E987D|nr:FAD-dependent monooxygenase [Oscillatoria sp. CS-180]MDB9525718.1 FAD-dependent monooxygenase [Oscillatoria sp. CS-180]
MNHVVVVGAGPSGAAIAFLLARQGIQVSLIERETQFNRVFRGEGLMPSGVEALYEMGLGQCLEAIPSRTLDAWDFYIDQQRRMRVVEPQGRLGKFSTQIICQSALLKNIVEQTKTLPHFKFYPGWQVRELIRSDVSVCGVKATNGHQTQDFMGDLVIVAEGRYSRSRKLADLSLHQSQTQFDVLWFKLPAPAEVLCETAFTVCLQRQRQYAFYPSWDERLQIGWIVEKGQGKTSAERDWAEEFAQAAPPFLAEHFREHCDELEGPIFLDVIVGVCPQWSIPGLLLIGDAAHPMAPNRAQGINMGLRDAIAAANHLVPVLQNSGTLDRITAALQAIQSERLPEIAAIQHLQLEEWQKIAAFTASPFTYRAFKTVANLLGRFGLTQQAWLYQQRKLRHGAVSVRLEH